MSARRLTEDELIAECFFREQSPRVLIGPGDDAAVVRVDDDDRLVCAIDTLVAGVHFDDECAAHALGHKSLAVSLSDIAAMGATPQWALVALTIPQADKAWCRAFADGLFALAEQHEVDLIGGDLTRGPLTITTQVLGVQSDTPLRRSGAQVGDGIYVTGDLGDAAFALKHDKVSQIGEARRKRCRHRLEYPTPRVRAGRIIARYATAGIDISDGLLQDLSRIVGGARIAIETIPLGEGCAQTCIESGDYTPVLAGGDDYELLFTMPIPKERDLFAELKRLPEGDARVTRIGAVEGADLCATLHGREYALPERIGFDHFAP